MQRGYVMKVSRLSENGWKWIHSGTALCHFTFSPAEIHAPFRVAWAKIEPRTEMATDNGHPEAEVFILTGGRSKLTVDEEEVDVGEGDTIYVPPFAAHQFKNDSDEEMTLIWIKYPEGSMRNLSPA